MLLRYDACSNIINGTAQIPKDVTEDDEIITMLEGMKRWKFFFFFFLLITVDQLPLFSNSVSFVQLQREERQGGGRKSFWKQPERGTSPLCPRWSASDISRNFGAIYITHC